MALTDVRRLGGIRYALLTVLSSVMLACGGSGEVGQAPVEPTQGPVSPVEPTQGPVSVAIDGAIKYQTMEGIGGTHIPFDFKRVWQDAIVPLEKRKELAQVLHSTMGITRIRIGGGVSEPVNDNADPFTFEWSSFDWTEHEWNVAYVQLATSFGLVTWFSHGAARDTMPKWLTNADNFSLNDRMIDEFVEWRLADALRFRDKGVEYPYIGIMNEPHHNLGESITPHQMVAIVKRLGHRMAQAGLKTKIYLPDDVCLGRSLEYIQPVLADQEARQYVGALAYHPYCDVYPEPKRTLRTSGEGNPPQEAVAPRHELKRLSQMYGIPVWQTEICPNSDDGSSPHEFALAQANHMHDEFTLADASAFDLCTTFDEDLIRLHFDAQKHYVGYTIEQRGYVVGHYSRFIRPESVRIATRSSDQKVRLTAFLDPQNKRASIVVINNHGRVVPAQFTVHNLLPIGPMEGLVTTETQHWQSLQPTDVQQGAFEMLLAAQSVTTVFFPY